MKQEFDQDNITSKVITYKTGEVFSGKSFSRGALYALLSNHIYIGKIRHKDKTYDGQHEGIIPESLWQAVQDKLKVQASVGRGQEIGKHINLLKTYYLMKAEPYLLQATHLNQKSSIGIISAKI